MANLQSQIDILIRAVVNLKAEITELQSKYDMLKDSILFEGKDEYKYIDNVEQKPEPAEAKINVNLFNNIPSSWELENRTCVNNSQDYVNTIPTTKRNAISNIKNTIVEDEVVITQTDGLNSTYYEDTKTNF